MKPALIYSVEDDQAASNIAAYALEAAGFGVRVFPEAKSFFEGMKQDKPDLILLDIMLPGTDGISVLRKLKEDSETRSIPVIMTTAKGTEFDKVNGLDLGADDYLVKPFGMLEMVSRVKAVLRRCREDRNPQNILRAGPVELDLPAHTASIGQKQLDLTLKEYSLLELFLNNQGRVFDREMLLSRVWNNEYAGDTRTVDVHIGTLRSKLGDAGHMIKTVRGVGYKLEAPDDKTDF